MTSLRDIQLQAKVSILEAEVAQLRAENEDQARRLAFWEDEVCPREESNA